MIERTRPPPPPLSSDRQSRPDGGFTVILRRLGLRGKREGRILVEEAAILLRPGGPRDRRRQRLTGAHLHRLLPVTNGWRGDDPGATAYLAAADLTSSSEKVRFALRTDITASLTTWKLNRRFLDAVVRVPSRKP